MECEVLIVGAGPAGCAAAFDLASAGKHVLLVDRRQFPRRKPCGGALTVKAVKALRYSIAPVVRDVTTHFAARNRDRESRVFRGRSPICALTIRSEFDQFCLERTMQAGAEFQTIGHISALKSSGDAIVLEADGRAVRARFVIGADGAGSRVRQLAVRSEWFRSGLALEVDCARPAREVNLEFDFGVVDAGYAWVFPKGDHVNAGLYTCGSDQLSRGQLESFVRRRVGTERIGSIVGHRVAFGGSLYEPGRGRILLAGDAAGFVEPLLGEGIYNAIRSGQEAAAAIVTAMARGGDAAAEYGERLRPIKRDLANCARIAAKFYADVDRGYRALTAPAARNVFMKGYALGLTFTAMRRWAPLLRLIPVIPSSKVMAVTACRPSPATQEPART